MGPNFLLNTFCSQFFTTYAQPASPASSTGLHTCCTPAKLLMSCQTSPCSDHPGCLPSPCYVPRSRKARSLSPQKAYPHSPNWKSSTCPGLPACSSQSLLYLVYFLGVLSPTPTRLGAPRGQSQPTVPTALSGCSRNGDNYLPGLKS